MQFTVDSWKILYVTVPIPVAARSKVQFCCRLFAGTGGSNPAGGMDICLL